MNNLHFLSTGLKSIVCADEHLAYWTAIQHSVVKMKGENKAIPTDLRETEIFRKDEGEWKLMHRHAHKLAKK